MIGMKHKLHLFNYKTIESKFSPNEILKRLSEGIDTGKGGELSELIPYKGEISGLEFYMFNKFSPSWSRFYVQGKITESDGGSSIKIKTGLQTGAMVLVYALAASCLLLLLLPKGFRILYLIPYLLIYFYTSASRVGVQMKYLDKLLVERKD